MPIIVCEQATTVEFSGGGWGWESENNEYTAKEKKKQENLSTTAILAIFSL